MEFEHVFVASYIDHLSFIARSGSISMGIQEHAVVEEKLAFLKAAHSSKTAPAYCQSFFYFQVAVNTVRRRIIGGDSQGFGSV